MDHRCLGRSGLEVSPIGFGAFKVGRNVGTKYPQGYDLPDEESAAKVLNEVVDAGVNLIDTAPAYGLSEERIGRSISHRRDEIVLSTKVGEIFEDGRSSYDFSSSAIRCSVRRSLDRLKTDHLDILLIHSDGDDLAILNQTDAVATLLDLREAGLVRAVGLSGKTVEGHFAALAWADVLMVEYNINDRGHEGLIADAASGDVGILVKKGLESGHLEPSEAVRFVLSNPGVASLVLGTLNVDHLRQSIAVVEAVRV